MKIEIGTADVFPSLNAALATRREPAFGEAAAPDVPVAVGWMLLGSFALIMSGFVLLYTGSRLSTMTVTISIVYTTIYLAVPAIFLRMEPQAKYHVTMAEFIDRGMHTWTGHVRGRDAIIQLLTIPLAVASAVFLIGLEAAVIL